MREIQLYCHYIYVHLLLAAVALSLFGAGDQASQAYNALKEKNYEQAVEFFRQAIAADPTHAGYRKELAYVLLKIGDTEAARDQFEEVIKLNPEDWHSALEYGYLCYETKRIKEARHIFDLVRLRGDASSKTVAETAFQNVDRPLGEAIQRWTEALSHNPNDFSAHAEVARAAEDRGEPKVAAEHYRRAWDINPAYRNLLVDLGRAQQQAGNSEGAIAAWLAASRGTQPRAAEAARRFLPDRYPYASEFEQAIALDRANVELRRELAFLWLAVKKPQQAEAEFVKLLEIAPADLLSMAQVALLRLARGDRPSAQPYVDKVLAGGDPALAARVQEALKGEAKKQEAPQQVVPRPQASRVDPRQMGDRSYDAGYLQDAARFYQAALEDNPKDPAVHLKLGYTYNLLRQDDEAVRHFEIALRGSTDERIKREAQKAYRNLKGSVAKVRTTVWMFPMFSSRWHAALGYGQVKTELRLAHLPFRPYVSLRFVGDSAHGGSLLVPQYLSESSIIGAVGITGSYREVTGWAEAGNAVRYRQRNDIGRMTPDYRMGLSYGRALGPGRSIAEAGWFVEPHFDVVSLSRFQWNSLVYSQTRGGYTLPPARPLHWQLTWNCNVVADRNREAWANFFETGPGLRFRVKALPASILWSVDFLRGWYRTGERAPYYDVRAGLWYGFTR